MTILVPGATGRGGAERAAQRAGGGRDVRAMTRRPDRYIAGPRVHAVAGDADDPTSLTAAFDGVDRAFLMSAEVPGAAQRPTHLPRLAQAAERAGVHHVVLLSVYSGAEGGDVLADWSRQVEEAVTGSEMTWTLLRPGRFMSNALQWAPQIRRSSEITIPFAFRPAASIDPADIAAVAAASLLSDDHSGAAYRLTGPEVLNPIQELAVLAELLHRPLRAMDPPLADVRAGMTRGGMPEAVVDAVLDRPLHGEGVTHFLPAVPGSLGRPPATFQDWATRRLDRFTH